MNGNEFIKRLKKLGHNPRLETKRGKGSHGTLYAGSGKTTLKDRKKEISTGLLNAMLNDLGIDKNDFWKGK